MGTPFGHSDNGHFLELGGLSITSHFVSSITTPPKATNACLYSDLSMFCLLVYWKRPNIALDDVFRSFDHSSDSSRRTSNSGTDPRCIAVHTSVSDSKCTYSRPLGPIYFYSNTVGLLCRRCSSSNTKTLTLNRMSRGN